MNQHARSLIMKYQGKKLLVDSNLLILSLIGRYNSTLIVKYKRTQQYSVEDFQILENLFAWFGSILTTPNILTEVSNLSFPLNKQTNCQLFSTFHKFIGTLEEKFIDSASGSSNSAFSRFGLTDSALYELGNQDCLVLTDDFPLYSYLEDQKIDVLNFNHIRSEGWLARQDQF
jgi:hypothetical protein